MKEKTKKLTVKYWMTLSESTKFRAVKSIYPLTSDSFIKSICKEKPDPKDCFWEKVFKQIRVLPEDSNYKLEIKKEVIYIN